MTAGPLNGISAVTRSLLELSRQQVEAGRAQVMRFNPRPPGVLHQGSASDAVLAFLRAQPQGQWLPKFRIVRCTGRSIKAVDHALRFLVSLGMVRAVPDEGRNSRYLRYQAQAVHPGKDRSA